MKVNVELGERSYDVVVADGARHELNALVASRAPRARFAALVTTATIAEQSWFDLESGVDQSVFVVEDGEGAKSLRSLELLLEALAERRLSRDDVVVGVGGGALTDLAGFAAATYRRGVALVQVPTSLVGQVDAAIGGKTGVNLAAGKNLVGAFYQPLGVLCDTSVLATLPDEERKSGLGEVAKCWLLEGKCASELSTTTTSELVEVSVRLKTRVVSGDEREGGARVLLNYGHTLAHALEKLSWERESAMRHGEAVAIGLAFAPRLAHALGRVDADVVREHDAVLDELGLTRRLPSDYEVEELLAAMAHDKKAHHDLSFVLAGTSGFELVGDVEPATVRETLERFKGET